MEEDGHRVESVINGLQAVHACLTGDFDLILMDLRMPELDGLAASRIIRQGERERRSPHAPIVALTADVLSDTRERCLEAGMDGVLTKPIRLAGLRGALQQFAGGPLAASRAAPLADALPLPAVSPPGVAHHPTQTNEINLEQLQQNMGFMSLQERREILLLTRENLTVYLKGCEESCAGNSWSQCREMAHKLAGAASSLFLDATVRRSRALEAAALQGRNEDARRLLEELRQHLPGALDQLESALLPPHS
ncbi:MAG: response regulator [Magnetococcus sp. WYHC-3]